MSASHNFSGAFNPTRIRKVFHQHKEWTADTAPPCHDNVLKLTRIPQLFRTSSLSNSHPELMLLAPGSATFGRVLRGWQESRRYFLLWGGEVKSFWHGVPDPTARSRRSQNGALYLERARVRNTASTGSNPA